MSIDVTFTQDPSLVLGEVRDFLATEPVRNNVMFTLLHQRVASGDPGRYWIAKDGESVCGVVFQSPLTYPALVTAMSAETVGAVVEEIVSAGIKLPGAGSDAATAAMFAGQWAERTKSAALPQMAGRQYECFRVEPPAHLAPGSLRLAEPGERDLLVEWARAFKKEADNLPGDPAPMVDLALKEERTWLWDDGGPRSMLVNSLEAENVVRIQAVYTPPEHRNRGYAGAGVATLTERILSAGHHCCLFTDLANPVSNSVYRRIGYRAVQEMLRYEFV